MHAYGPHARLVRLATAFDDATGDDEETINFELPEDLTALGDDELANLREEALAAFDALYGDGDEPPSAEDVETMEALADAADAIRAEETRREEERQANAEQAEALAARVHGSTEESEDDGGEETGDGDATDAGDTTEETSEEPAEPVAASSAPARRGGINVTLPGVRRRQPSRQPREAEPAQSSGGTLVAAPDLGGGIGGQDDVSLRDIAEALNRRAAAVNSTQYEQAYRTGRRLTNSFGVLSIRKQFDDDLVASPDNANDVLDRAADERRLPGGSLVASSGWCSPSETIYDLFSLESSDGLISLPEIQVERGGIRHTPGPDFQSLFADRGFHFTEQDDIDGDYQPDDTGATDKPCHPISCPTFSEDRLEVDGLCIQGHILQNRAYPEVTERVVSGSLVGHEHRLAGRIVSRLQTNSTAVPMPTDQVGAVAPLLTAIELQVEHYRYVHRMSRQSTLEVILPYWTLPALRSDLSRRLGVDLIDVSNARMMDWLATRGVSPQFIYNYQDLGGTADTQTAWPAEVKFLLYAAGTFVRGSADLITLESVFDSALFTQNDFTALFTEEAWLVAMRGHDSREVTVPICADGATHGGVEIACDGSTGT